MRGNNRRERKKWVKKWRKESKAQTDLNLVNCQREGLPYQIPGENRGPSYLLALQPAANHLYLIVRHKLYEDQLGIWPQSFLRHWIGVSASRESTEGCSRHVMCASDGLGLDCTVSFISVSCSTEHDQFLSIIVRVECRRVRSFLYKEMMCLF